MWKSHQKAAQPSSKKGQEGGGDRCTGAESALAQEEMEESIGGGERRPESAVERGETKVGLLVKS